MQNYKYDGSKRFNIKNFKCNDTGEFKERHETIEEFVENLEKINEYQQKLFAEQKEGIIFVFQAMDAAGKDGAVRAVLSCLSPQGVSEHSFKVPSAEENRHDYLWRFWSAIPEKGSISIFNRSYYEDVLVQKVHSIYKKNKYADRIDLDTMIDGRYDQIRNFEKYLWDNSIRVVKIFLNVSKDEQARRFLSRIDTQKKNWKFSSSDIDEREYWDEYMNAYETCINRTARKNTPWYVVPADHKWYARLIISRIVLQELENMDPQWPVLSDEEMQKLQEYKERLLSECDIKKEPKDTGKKIKPSATAISIAMKADRQALSEKKFQKQLKKSIFENFSERFGVSEQTQNELGKIYFTFEEMEAKAESENIAAVKDLCDEKTAVLEAELKGFGKEARKLLEHFKKAIKPEYKEYKANVNFDYSEFEEELKKFMAEYELEVGTQNMPADQAIVNYNGKVNGAFEALRTESEAKKSQTIERIEKLFEEYEKIAMAFYTDKNSPEEQQEFDFESVEGIELKQPLDMDSSEEE